MRYLKFRYGLLGALSFCALPLIAQEEPSTATDLSRYQIVDEDTPLRYYSDLIAFSESVLEQVQGDDCSDHLPDILEISDNANRIANVIAQGLEPFYDASRDDRDRVVGNRNRFAELVGAENDANALRRMRNEFWVLEAECYAEIGDIDGAITRFYRALDFIDSDNTALWDRARTQLWDLVDYR